MKRPVGPARKSPSRTKPKKQSVRQERARMKRTVKAVKRSDPRVVDFKRPVTVTRAVLRSLTLSVILLLVFVLVAVFSPLLAVEKVEVLGNSRISSKSLQSALKSQLGRPLPQVTIGDITKELQDFTLIQSVSVVNLPPHTLQVRIVERQPICIIETSRGRFLYDPAGVRIDAAGSSNKYPVVQAAGNTGNSAEFRAAVKALLALPVSLYPRVALVTANSIDSITFKLRGWAGQKVIWGDSSDAALKSRVLAALIANQKKTDRVTYDVSSPTAPTVRY